MPYLSLQPNGRARVSVPSFRLAGVGVYPGDYIRGLAGDGDAAAQLLNALGTKALPTANAIAPSLVQGAADLLPSGIVQDLANAAMTWRDDDTYKGFTIRTRVMPTATGTVQKATIEAFQWQGTGTVNGKVITTQIQTSKSQVLAEIDDLTKAAVQAPAVVSAINTATQIIQAPAVKWGLVGLALAAGVGAVWYWKKGRKSSAPVAAAGA